MRLIFKNYIGTLMSLTEEIEPDEYYANFLEMLKDVLNGNMDSVTYEDTIRQRFGVQAYMSYTLDKVIGNAVRQVWFHSSS